MATKKKTTKKSVPVSKKAPPKKSPAKKAVKKPAAKKVAKKAPAKKAVKKPIAKKAPAKKAAKKAPAKKAAKKVVAKKAPAKKAVKKVVAKKAPAKKAVKKPVAKKVPAKKAVKKVVAKKAPVKKAVKAPLPKKPVRKPAQPKTPKAPKTPKPPAPPAPIVPKVMTAKELEKSRKAEKKLQDQKIGGYSNNDLLDLLYPEEEKAQAENRLSKKELKEMKELLLAERKRLLRRAESLQGQSLTRADEVNPEEDGTDAFMRTTELAKANMAELDVGKIDEALRAIEEGTYGICKNCKQKIGRERLHAHPFAKFCVKCQEQMELDEQLRRSMAEQESKDL